MMTRNRNTRGWRGISGRISILITNRNSSRLRCWLKVPTFCELTIVDLNNGRVLEIEAEEKVETKALEKVTGVGPIVDCWVELDADNELL